MITLLGASSRTVSHPQYKLVASAWPAEAGRLVEVDAVTDLPDREG